MRCSKAERKRKENGRQTGTLGGGGVYVLGAPTRRDCLVQFSSVQCLFQQAPSPGFNQWSVDAVDGGV